MKKYLPIFTLTLLLLASSCAKEEYSDKRLLSDIVTIEDAGEGKPVTFSFRRYDDSPLITLKALNGSVGEEWAGHRILLRYYPEDGQPYTSGNITVAAMNAINYDTLRVRNVEKYDWEASPVFLNSVWRTGKYLNMRMRVEYSQSPRLFGLMVDSVTVDSVQPQLYLLHNRLGEPENYLTEIYASFDLSPVWDLPGCRSVKVHINDTNHKEEFYIFKKPE